MKSTRASFFTKFVAISSQLGVAIGVAALIVVMSVMNGFKQEMVGRFLATTAHVLLVPGSGAKPAVGLGQYQTVNFFPLEAAIINNGHFLPIRLAATKKNNDATKLIVPQIIAQQFDLANTVKVVSPGRAIIAPNVELQQVLVQAMPVWQSGFAYVAFALAEKFALVSDKSLPHIAISLTDPYMATVVANKLSSQNPGWQVSSWPQNHTDFFQLIAAQKTMMFLVLFFMVIIAGFGLISGQVMLVQEKRREIAILITMGFSANSLLISYFIRGLLLGVIGLFFGLLAGLFIASKVTALVAIIEKVIGYPWLTSALSGMNHMPSKILACDIWQIFIYGLGLCALTPIYPAYLASRAEPVIVFRQQEGG